jgi:hypothetical protein
MDANGGGHDYGDRALSSSITAIAPTYANGSIQHSGSTVPFEPLADLVRKSLIAEYRLQPKDLKPYGGDPFEWGHDPGDGVSRPGPTHKRAGVETRLHRAQVCSAVERVLVNHRPIS